VPDNDGVRRRIGYALAWLLATTVAIAVGVSAVSTVGAQVRGRGPLGNEVIRTSQLEGTAKVDPADASVKRTIEGEWGAFLVRCQGPVAFGVEVRPARSVGWRVVSFERGPDDDVDAVFSNGRRSFDLEVFCNRGEPTVGEIEENTLPDD
jgi:hypothetical protein